MVSKDQAIGGVICLVCVVVAVFYLITLFYPRWLADIGLISLVTAETEVRFWVVAVPVFVAFVAVMAIGAWIGWTMATTPPPKPIEEITTEMEEKKEELKVEAPKPEEAATETSVEEKKPEKKRKS
jgi:hypothetical protein